MGFSLRSLLAVVIALLWYFSFLLPENLENFVQPLVTLSLQYLTGLIEFIVQSSDDGLH